MFSNQIEELVHLYVDGAFNRRELLRRVTAVTGSSATAAVAVAALGVTESAQAQTGGCADLRVPEDARDVESVLAEFPGPAGKVYGYLSLPRKPFAGQMPAILVIHENRGLNDHIKDVTRRVARAGYVGLGIDLVSRWGGSHSYPDPADAAIAYRNVTNATALEDMQAALSYLRTLGVVKGDRIGSVGFCAGGAHSFNLAVNQPDLTAAVVYYGAPPTPIESVANIQARLLLHYAELDRALTARVAPAMTALLDMRKAFELHVHEGSGHAFNNDTGANYNGAVACEAWSETLAFFAKHLAGN